MTSKNFIFVAGHHKSGTSLLHGILREHPLISGLSETLAPKDEGQHLQTVIEPAKAYGGPGRYAYNKNAYLNENHPLATEQSAKTMFEEWEIYYDSKCEYYIEKSPPNLIRTRFLQKLFPNSRFVVILRHPLAVGYATQKVSKTSIRSLIRHTLIGYEIFVKDMGYLENVYVLRYEDFAVAPQDEINKVYDFLGLTSIPIRQSVKDDVNDRYFSMWENDRKYLLNRLLFSANGRLEERANRFGYSFDDYRRLLPSTLLGAHENQPRPTTQSDV